MSFARVHDHRNTDIYWSCFIAVLPNLTSQLDMKIKASVRILQLYF